MNERLKELRKSLDLTQQEFADRLKISRNTYSSYESGRNVPSDAAIGLICREFHVSEQWLRTGEGQREEAVSQEDELIEWADRVLGDRPDSFRKRFVKMMMSLTVDEWELLEQKALQLLADHEETDSDKSE